jgi:hypothetical protein
MWAPFIVYCGRLSLTFLQWLFDFTSGMGTMRSAGGNMTAANVATFPALFANGIAMTIGHMG